MSFFIDVLIGGAVCIAVFAWWWINLPEGAKWEIAAADMKKRGYSDHQVRLAFGQRPKPVVEDSSVTVAPTPEQMWDSFIARLNEVEPLGKLSKDGHQSFLGSIAHYRRIFLDAQKRS